MKILSTVANGVTKAIDFVVEANRKTALINRIKLVVKSEEKNVNAAFIALGKYYFNNLRDKSVEETERHCRAVETARTRLDRALTKLEELTGEDDEDDEDACSGCDSDCDECYYEDYDSAAAVQDLKTLDGLETGAETEEEEEEPEKPAPTPRSKNREAADAESDGGVIPPDKV